MTDYDQIMFFWDVLPSPTTDKYKPFGHTCNLPYENRVFKMYNTWKSLDEYLANIKIRFWFNMFSNGNRPCNMQQYMCYKIKLYI
jgi:hypothetical protein